MDGRGQGTFFFRSSKKKEEKEDGAKKKTSGRARRTTRCVQSRYIKKNRIERGEMMMSEPSHTLLSKQKQTPL